MPSDDRRLPGPLCRADEARARVFLAAAPAGPDDLELAKSLLSGALALIEQPRADRRGTKTSAWLEAVRAGLLRDDLVARGLDATVRAIALELGTSSGQVGDLLQIRDAFSDGAVLLIGMPFIADDHDMSLLEARGHARLARLSFRALRAVSRLPAYSRNTEVRRLAEMTDDRTNLSDDAEARDSRDVTVDEVAHSPRN